MQRRPGRFAHQLTASCCVRERRLCSGISPALGSPGHGLHARIWPLPFQFRSIRGDRSHHLPIRGRCCSPHPTGLAGMPC